MQGDVQKAQKVVIIGAGAVGLEYAGASQIILRTQTLQS
jgi:pyruvate/2-oxoglutarate dehydrogenase complex dihydrolipoamide dehydrogenase (E3) component